MELACRVCLQVEELMVHIFEEDEELQSDLSTLLESCGGIKVERNDCYPKYLCKECTSELLLAAKFRDKCERSLEIIKQLAIGNKLVEVVSETGVDEELVETPETLTNIETTNEDTDVDSLNEFLLLHNKPSKQVQNVTSNEIVLEMKPDEDDVIEDMMIDAKDGNGINDDQLISEDVQTADVQNGCENTDDVIEICFDAIEEGVTNCALPAHNESQIVNILKSYEFSEKDAQFNCDICGALFQHCGNLKRHMETTHMPLQMYVCENCEHCFSQEAIYSEHCVNCTANTTDKNSNNQSTTTTNNSTNNDTTCPYCSKRTANPFALKMHLRTHTGERPFPCEHCGKGFKTQSALKTHLKRHMGIPDYVCSICSKTFYESSNLRAHMRTHTGEKPHVCTVCKKGFSRVFLLQTHMRIHTGERPYLCQYCERRFAQSSDLKSHELVHEGQRRYKCPYCEKTFNQKRSMTQHANKHFGVNDEAEYGIINYEPIEEDLTEDDEQIIKVCAVIENTNNDGIDLLQNPQSLTVENNWFEMISENISD